MLNEVLEALKVNVRVEALYIQNFESGFYNEQLALLTEVLKLKRIWLVPVPVASPRRYLEFVSRPPWLRHPRCGTGASTSVRTSAPRCRLGSASARSCRRQQSPTCVPTPYSPADNASLETYPFLADRYASEHHFIGTDLKNRMRDAIRETRKANTVPRSIDVIKCIGNMWHELPSQLACSPIRRLTIHILIFGPSLRPG